MSKKLCIFSINIEHTLEMLNLKKSFLYLPTTGTSISLVLGITVPNGLSTESFIYQEHCTGSLNYTFMESMMLCSCHNQTGTYRFLCFLWRRAGQCCFNQGDDASRETVLFLLEVAQLLPHQDKPPSPPIVTHMSLENYEESVCACEYETQCSGPASSKVEDNNTLTVSRSYIITLIYMYLLHQQNYLSMLWPVDECLRFQLVNRKLQIGQAMLRCAP